MGIIELMVAIIGVLAGILFTLMFISVKLVKFKVLPQPREVAVRPYLFEPSKPETTFNVDPQRVDDPSDADTHIGQYKQTPWT